MVWCLLAGVHGLRAAVQPEDSGTCDPLSQTCGVESEEARTRLLEYYLQGSAELNVSEVVVTPFADGQLPASTPTTRSQLKAHLIYALDPTRSKAERDYVGLKLIPAALTTLSRSIRVPFLVDHMIHHALDSLRCLRFLNF
jgi:hypothetical protein